MAIVDSARTSTLSIYHINCEVLLEGNTKPKKCLACKKHRKSLSSIACRPQKDERTNPSSHTTYTNLHTPEKIERMTRLHPENKKAKLRIVRLEKKIVSATNEDGINLSNTLHDDMIVMANENANTVFSSYSEGTFQRLFWEQQQKASSLQNCRSMKWHPLFIKWCLYLRHLSGKSYELLRNSGCIKLPSQSTLRDYTHYIKTSIGFSTEVDKDLLNVSFLSNELNKYVVLVMDEVHIKNDLVYDKHQGCLIGFTNLGETNNSLLKFESALSGDEQYQQPLATSMIVLMVRGLFFKLNYPYAQFACSSLKGDLLFDPVWEAIARLEGLGFCVLALSCDGASPNRRLWSLHSDKKNEMLYKVPNVFAKDGRHLYFISDPPHLLKTIRNSWSSNNRNLWVR